MSEQYPSRLTTPETDLAAFTDHLSQAWGVLTGAPAAQYVAWSSSAGVFSAMSGKKTMTAGDLCETTILNEDGVDSLFPILMVLGLVTQAAGTYSLTVLAKEYFLPESPYYVGAGLFLGCNMPIPSAYLRSPESAGLAVDKAFTPPDPSLYLKIQISRNLAPGVVAARSGQFAGIRHLIDIGGGAGAIAIPFALENPDASVTLVDLPPKVDHIREIVRSYGLEKQIEICGMDVFADSWQFPSCDGMLFGNFFHVFPDSQCHLLFQRCFDTLVTGGKIFLHELLFDEGRAGPMIAALWNANMHVIGGRQRTASEFRTMLHHAGFSDVRVRPTSGRFSLLEARKPS